MARGYVRLILSFFVFFCLAGCATTTLEEHDLSLKQATLKPLSLEEQVEDKDQQIKILTSALEKEKKQKQRLVKIVDRSQKKKAKKESKVGAKKISTTYYLYLIQVQTALKKAGFDIGLIDGKWGSRTQGALKKFQQKNNLPISGRIDEATWEALRVYLKQ